LALPAAAETRILLVGDSWAAFGYSWGSYDSAMAAKGLSEFGLDAGGAIGATTVENWASDDPLEVYGTPAANGRTGRELITDELAGSPTVDIVHISLGGNDFIGGVHDTMTREELDALYDGWVADLDVLVDHIHSISSEIKIGVCGYDFLNRTKDSWTRQEFNEELVRFSAKIRDYCLATPNCDYVHNFGLMQYTYGDPPTYGPGEVPAPGDADTNYLPFPGGDTARAPVQMADVIHLNADGFQTLFENCIDQYYMKWLTPGVDSVIPKGLARTSSDTVAFLVTFTEPVSGVDVSDFDLTTTGTIAGASVTEVKGSGASYTVIVATGSGSGTIALTVLDDGTIQSIASGTPLGGSAVGNGEYTSALSFEIDETLTVPLAAWPLALVLIGMTIVLLTRRRHA